MIKTTHLDKKSSGLILHAGNTSYKLLVMDKFIEFKNHRITLEQLEDTVVDLVDQLEYNYKDYPKLKEEGKIP